MKFARAGSTPLSKIVFSDAPRREAEFKLNIRAPEKKAPPGLRLYLSCPNISAVSCTDGLQEAEAMKFAGLVALSTIGVMVLGVTDTHAALIGAAAIGGGPYETSLVTKTGAMPHCGIDPRHHRHCQPLRKPASKT